MFLVLGLFTLVLGVVIFIGVPDTPIKAWFLSDEERVNLLEHVKVNQTGIEPHKWRPLQVLEGALGVQLLLMVFIVVLVRLNHG